MIKYILKRLLAGLLTIFVLITIAFFLMHAMPGQPLQSGGTEKADRRGPRPPEREVRSGPPRVGAVRHLLGGAAGI